MKIVIYLFIIFINLFVVNHLNAQLRYKVRNDVKALQCGSSGECDVNCCYELNSMLTEGTFLYPEENSCNDNNYLNLSNSEYECYVVSEEDIGFFFGKIKPQYLYTETGASLDVNAGNTSVSSMINLFISYYKPIKRFDNQSWWIGGIRSGISYGVVLADTNSAASGESIIKFLKTEAVFGRHSSEKDLTISISLGFSPINYREGNRIDQVYPHIAANLTYIINSKNGWNLPNQDKKR